MVLSETRGHTAISGCARGHRVEQGPRPIGHVGRLLILMLARDLYDARDYAAATGVMNTRSSCQPLALCGSIMRLAQLVSIELASVLPKSQSDVGDLSR